MGRDTDPFEGQVSISLRSFSKLLTRVWVSAASTSGSVFSLTYASDYCLASSRSRASYEGLISSSLAEWEEEFLPSMFGMARRMYYSPLEY